MIKREEKKRKKFIDTEETKKTSKRDLRDRVKIIEVGTIFEIE